MMSTDGGGGGGGREGFGGGGVRLPSMIEAEMFCYSLSEPQRCHTSRQMENMIIK